jgi:threonine synthase
LSFISTRVSDEEVTFSKAILHPSAKDGGLYLPKKLPKLDSEFFKSNLNTTYKELAYKIVKKFDIDIEDNLLKEALSLYDNFDNKNNPIPLVKVKDDLFISELYHGPTRAFKDIALQPFGHILSQLAKNQNQNFLILAATSGDTGPATLDTFKNKKNIKVVCLYPDGGTSDVQRLQMTTMRANNIEVIGVDGNFDDTQNALKSLLASPSFKDELDKSNIKLSAANSVNFGRIIFQIIYHIYSYIELLKKNEIEDHQEIYITVPSGNFGNALGAYYAKKMGLPVKKILITSNANSVLSELINSGVYNIQNRELIKTISPAMDILRSSNVERVLFDKFGYERTAKLMDDLNKNNQYRLTKEELKSLKEDFEAISTDDTYALESIKSYVSSGYLMDPHTATAIKAYEELKKEPIKMVVCSTAQWTKFAPTILNSIREDSKKYSDYEALLEVEETLNEPITSSIKELFNRDIIFDKVVKKEDIEQEILRFIKN